MTKTRTSAVEISVHLVVPGVGTRDYHLAEGATLGDLLRLSGSETAHQTVFVEGLPFEEAVPLRDGAVVTIVPRPRSASGDEPWRASVPAFRDEELAREYSEAIRTRRETDPDEELRGDHS